MPLYEYECSKCHHRFEKIQKFSDPHVTKCPKCRAKIEQVISAPAVQFKGSGWYVTDYAKKSGHSEGASSTKTEASTDSKSDSKSETKTDSKAESKTETKPESKKDRKK